MVCSYAAAKVASLSIRKCFNAVLQVVECDLIRLPRDHISATMRLALGANMQPEQQQVPLQTDEKQKCRWCGSTRLTLVDEQPHPLFGVLGMTLKKFQCDEANCAKLTFA